MLEILGNSEIPFKKPQNLGRSSIKDWKEVKFEFVNTSLVRLKTLQEPKPRFSRTNLRNSISQKNIFLVSCKIMELKTTA